MSGVQVTIISITAAAVEPANSSDAPVPDAAPSSDESCFGRPLVDQFWTPRWKPTDLTAEFGRCARERQIGLTVSPIGPNGCQDFVCGLQGHFRCRQALGTTAW